MIKLIDLLKALSSNTNINIRLLDDNDITLIEFPATYYKSIESDLGSREVKRIKFLTPSYSSEGLIMVISVEDAVAEAETTEDPTPTPEPTTESTNP